MSTLSKSEKALLASLLAKSNQSASVKGSSKGAAKVEKQSKIVPVKQSQDFDESDEMTARADNNIRVRVPHSFFSPKSHKCTINGERVNQQVEKGEYARGRITVRSLGAVAGSIVQFERVEGKKYEFTCEVISSPKGSKVVATKAKVAPTPVKTSTVKSKGVKVKSKSTPKIECLNPKCDNLASPDAGSVCDDCAEMLSEKYIAKLEREAKGSKKLAKSSASVKSSSGRRSNFEVTDPSAPATFKQKMAIKRAGVEFDWDELTKGEASEMIAEIKGSEVVAPAKAKGSAKIKVGKAKAQVVPAKKVAGTSAEWVAYLKSARKVVKANKKAGIVNENPNCTYGVNDGRRFFARAERKEFNQMATKAGFYGIEGLAKAGELLLAKD